MCIGGNIIDPSSWKGMEWNQLSAAIGALLSSAIDARLSSVIVARLDFDEYEPRRTGHCCGQGLLGPDTPRRRRAGPPDPVLPTASFAGGGELAPQGPSRPTTWIASRQPALAGGWHRVPPDYTAVTQGSLQTGCIRCWHSDPPVGPATTRAETREVGVEEVGPGARRGLSGG